MPSSEWPSVSAICITGQSPWHVSECLPRAIEAFQAQTYPGPMELVIVNDSGTWPKGLARGPGITRVALTRGPTLGELRNIGLDAAHGELAIQWDDDDLHHPMRTVVQVQGWRRRPETGCFLRRQVAYSLRNNIAFIREGVGRLPIVGTILHPNDPDRRYPALNRHEDTRFFRLWPNATILNNPARLYVRTAHDRGASGLEHVMAPVADWADGRWELPEKDERYLRRALELGKVPLLLPGDQDALEYDPAQEDQADAR